jgi:ankyrin repeat protein
MTYAAGAHTDIVLLLLAKGVDPNAIYKNDLTALMWAAGFGRTATVKALLTAGAKPQLKDNRGKTAADMAREGHFDETAAVLEVSK